MEPGIAIPILPARDRRETWKFYERLGFTAAGWWPNEFGGYAISVRGVRRTIGGGGDVA